MFYLLSSKGIATVLKHNRVEVVIEERERLEEALIDVIFKSKTDSFCYTLNRSVLERFEETSAKTELWETFRDRLIMASALRISFVQFIKDAPVEIPENILLTQKINLK